MIVFLDCKECDIQFKNKEMVFSDKIKFRKFTKLPKSSARTKLSTR